MSCNKSFVIDLVQCPDTIKVWAGLLPNTDYAWLLTDVHGNEYYEYVTTDGSGNFEIDTTSDIFPDGLFNYNAGAMTLEVFQYYPYYYYNGEPEDLTFCGEVYDSVTINFVKSNTTQDVSTQHIKCQ